MSTLLLSIVLGIFFAIFAVQNNAAVPVRMFGLELIGIPLYLVALGALFIGILVSSFFNIADWIYASSKIRSRESKLRDNEKIVNRLNQRISDLESENSSLRTRTEMSKATNSYVPPKEKFFYTHDIRITPRSRQNNWEKLKSKLQEGLR